MEFTQEEIKELEKNYFIGKSELWVRAFKYFNSDPNNIKVGMGCRPCYIKVLKYIKSKWKN
jgi:hypothetical protein